MEIFKCFSSWFIFFVDSSFAKMNYLFFFFSWLADAGIFFQKCHCCFISLRFVPRLNNWTFQMRSEFPNQWGPLSRPLAWSKWQQLPSIKIFHCEHQSTYWWMNKAVGLFWPFATTNTLPIFSLLPLDPQTNRKLFCLDPKMNFS